MSEFIVAMDGSNGFYVGEHAVRRVLAGDAETVRRRLVDALEELGYTVLNENPLQARRPALKDILRADFNEYSRRLTVSLRPGSETAVSAVFDFAVVHAGIMTKGDRRTLEREVDAIVALSDAPRATGACRSCGTENGSDARFCRLCGAPGTASRPAELEVLRLTAGSHAALQELVFGLLVVFLSLVCLLPLILGAKPKAVNAGLVLLAVGQSLGWLLALYGLLRLHRTINPRGEAERAGAAAVPPSRMRETATLPPPAPRLSVTEGTTELLDVETFTREKVPVPRERADTNPFN